jgi:pre-mRNA-splicing factor ISY1
LPAAGLGEARIRDLNDEINKLIREKGHWEKQVKALGGPDHAALAPKMFDADGKALPGGGGYKYFGAARELPGVRELFEGAAKEKPQRSRAQIMRNITPDYYGYRDEDDGTLLEAEAAAEKALVARAEKEWHAQQRARKRARVGAGPGEAGAEAGEAAGAVAAGAVAGDGGEEDGEGAGDAAAARASSGAGGVVFRAHVPVPTQAEIEALVLEKKKALLLAKYASQTLQAEQAEARTLLNVRGPSGPASGPPANGGGGAAAGGAGGGK